MQLPTLMLGGEIDLQSTRDLAASLGELIGDPSSAAVIDVSAVTFIDSTGLGALVKANERLRRQGRQLILVCPPGAVRDLLAATNLLDSFIVVRDRAAADAAHDGLIAR